MTISENKQDLRQKARNKRKALSAEYRQSSARKLASVLSALDKHWPYGILAGYCAMGSELDVMPALAALEAKGRPIALPVIEGDRLLFRHYATGQALHHAMLNTREPDSGNPTCIPSIVLVPVLAFDTSLMRLGQGAGFYDRTLAALRRQTQILTVGIAFECQKTDAIPAEPHDQRLDLLVTEHARYLSNAEQQEMIKHETTVSG